MKQKYFLTGGDLNPGPSDLQSSILTTRPVLHYTYEIGVRYCIYVLTLAEHLSSI